MLYFFLVILLVAVGFVVWRISQTPPGHGDGPVRGPRREAPRGPDDDPDFLRRL
ncbi:MAG: hypothetical protein QM809_07045 [Gordonia sp. (in: high G+C Gram-positive bacteria)]|uniref:hypothetical protein n=1 Tax=Gordonia sp. (in: high G+C Gram-positive bacteria) TaxID=84139 RepID=UPI0039E5A8EF